jgi:hypothetical protein
MPGTFHRLALRLAQATIKESQGRLIVNPEGFTQRRMIAVEVTTVPAIRPLILHIIPLLGITRVFDSSKAIFVKNSG